MSEDDARPWGDGEPPHGWVCLHCGKTFTEPGGCGNSRHGLHFRSLSATANWHRTIEEVAAVSMANARRTSRRGKFVVKINLDEELFAGGYKNRDMQISAVLRGIADRVMLGQYSADESNGVSVRWDRVGSFKFKEGT